MICTKDLYFSQFKWFVKCLNNAFTSQLKKNMQLFASQDMNWWTGVVWITCVMFLCAVWTLILMALIHCRGSIGEQVM